MHRLVLPPAFVIHKFETVRGGFGLFRFSQRVHHLGTGGTRLKSGDLAPVVPKVVGVRALRQTDLLDKQLVPDIFAVLVFSIAPSHDECKAILRKRPPFVGATVFVLDPFETEVAHVFDVVCGCSDIQPAGDTGVIYPPQTKIGLDTIFLRRAPVIVLDDADHIAAFGLPDNVQRNRLFGDRSDGKATNNGIVNTLLKDFVRRGGGGDLASLRGFHSDVYKLPFDRKQNRIFRRGAVGVPSQFTDANLLIGQTPLRFGFAAVHDVSGGLG